jgi:hypothetical protein
MTVLKKIFYEVDKFVILGLDPGIHGFFNINKNNTK